MQIISEIGNFLWSYVVSFVLLGIGLYYAIRLGFPQFRHFGKLLSNVLKGQKTKDGAGSGFAAFCATVGSQVGTGSLVGVASALAAGGPGAMFWMWVVALLGMGISFGEAVLGQLFREKGEDGNYYGGVPYYIRNGLKLPWLGMVFAASMIFSVGFCIAMIQNNSIAAAFVEVVPIPRIVPGLVVTAVAALIVMGGVKRITDVASKIVPFMAGGFILITIVILVLHVKEIPAMFVTIVTSAFTGHAAAGGVIGYTVMQAFRQGVARGLFSNDAGNGAAAGINASAVVKHPVNQGMSAMLGTFITTIIICTCTGFAILLTGSLESGKDGINLVQTVFGSTLGEFGKWVVLIAMILFGFTTLIADIFVGEASIRYLIKKHTDRYVLIYKIAALIVATIGSVLALPTLWSFVDLCGALMILINVIPLLALFRCVKYVLRDYEGQLAKGVKEPVWDEKPDVLEVSQK